MERQRASGNISGTRSWTATGIGAENNQWTLNGTASRSGSHEVTARRQRSFDSTTKTTYTDLLIDKATRQIIGGSANANITIISENGTAHTFTATATFTPTGTVNIRIEGDEFSFELYG